MNIVHTIRIATSTAAAIAEIQKYEGTLVGAAQTIEKHANTLSGGKILKNANEWTAAVGRLGGATKDLATSEQLLAGASKLTVAEKEKVNKVVSEAIAKYEALGKTAPAAMIAVRDATAKAVDPTAALSGSLTKFASGARSFGFGLTAAVTAPIVAAGAAVVKFGMDAVESENLVSVSFGNMKSSADAWAAGLSRNLGLNRFETEKMAGTLFNMTTSMGLTRDAAFKMSTGVVQLAADMSSFRNIPMEEALNKIRSGLTGEAEPLKQIGILVNEATVKTYAYMNGIAKQGKELTEQQKVMARYGLILKQTSNDQGDLARTMDSPANQLRIMRARVEEAATSLGITLMPTIQSVIGGIANLVPYIQSGVEWFTKLPSGVQLTAIAFLGIAAAGGPVLLLLSSMASSVVTLLPLLGAGGLAGAVTTVQGLLAGFVAHPVVLALTAIAGAAFMVHREMENSTAAVRNNIQALNDHKIIQDAFNSTTPLTIDQQKRLEEALKRTHDATYIGGKGLGSLAGFTTGLNIEIGNLVTTAGTLPPVLDADAKAFQKLVDAMSGKALADKVAELTRIWLALTPAQRDAAIQSGRMTKEIRQLQEAGALLSPELLRVKQTLSNAVPGATSFFDTVRVGTDDLRDFSMVLPTATAGAKSFFDQFEGRRPLMTLPFDGEQVNSFFDQFKPQGAAAGFSWADGFADAASGVWDSVTRAIEGGGNVLMAAVGTLANSAAQFFAASFKSGVDAEGKSFATAGDKIAGAAASAILGVTASIITDMLKPSYTALEQLARAANTTVAEITARLQGMGEAGVKAFNDMQAAGLSFASLKQRIKGFDDAKELLGFVDQFQTKEQLETVAAQWKATYDYMLSSGLYTTASLADAWQRYQDALQAATGTPGGSAVDDLVAGFPTRAQLEEAAANAEAAYRRMLASGQYTEDVLAQAWNNWADAAAAAGNTTLQAIRDIDAELKSLNDLVANEAWEEVMGNDEIAARARIEALEAEKAAKLAAIDEQMVAELEAAAAASDSADDAIELAKTRANELDSYLTNLFKDGYQIPITFRLPNGLPTPPAPAFGGAMADGGSGVVSRPTLFLAGEAGPEHYNFTPVGRGGGGGGNTLHVNVNGAVIREEQDIKDLALAIAREVQLQGWTT
jgi:hypothetical protein